MNLRQRILLAFSVIAIVSVAAVAWVVSQRTQTTFEQADQERTVALISQVRLAFRREGDSIVRTLERLSSSEHLQRVAFDALHGGDTSVYVRDAAQLAQENQLDFLEILTAEGTIISSAQAPARFGYEEAIPPNPRTEPFLESVALTDSTALGLVSFVPVRTPDGILYLYGGRRVDQAFIQNLSTPQGMYIWLYGVGNGPITSQNIVGTSAAPVESLASLIRTSMAANADTTGFVQFSADRFDRATVQAIPLRDDSGRTTAVLCVGASRRLLLELQQHIKTIAFSVAAIGILFAILATLWITARFTRPIEKLAAASEQVAAGNWDTRVEVTSRDELGRLAESFNTMTHQLIEQRDRLVQSERVAAWRELARRLAHELKNPLFPLQITVENLVRARQLSTEEFEEVFQESTTTLLAELANLKTIIGRFSDFSKMPRPQLQPTSVNDIAERIASLLDAQLASHTPPHKFTLDLDHSVGDIPLDSDLIYRALSNLVLNAVDAMPSGGTVTLITREVPDQVVVEVQDTGGGLTSEERDRLFTPYYTTKQHGTGLGLAIVQSVVSDHQGSISVSSEPGKGATFTIHLPKHPSTVLAPRGASA